MTFVQQMLTNLEEVFQAPTSSIAGPPVDPRDIEAMAQHEHDRLAAIQRSQAHAVDESGSLAQAEDREKNEPQKRAQPSEERVSLSISETGAVKLSVLAAQAIGETGQAPGKAF